MSKIFNQTNPRRGLSVFLICFSFFLTPLTTYSELPQQLKTDEAESFFEKYVSSIDINFGVDLIKLKGNGLEASLGYRVGVSPSYIGGLYSRFDQYPIGFSINPFEKLAGKSGLGVRLSASATLQYIRQKPSYKEATLTMPISPKRAPRDSQLATEMAEGDYASFVYNVVGFAGVDKSWTEVVNTDLKAGYTVGTLFGVQVYKLRKNHVRLRIFSERSRGEGFSWGSRLNRDEFDIFGTEYVNDMVLALIRRDLIGIQGAEREREIYFGDYVVNLNDPEARRVYDELLEKVVDPTHKDKKVLFNPLRRDSASEPLIIKYTADLEKTFQEDYFSAQPERRVTRIFLGKAVLPNSSSQGFKIGNSIISFQNGQQYFDTNLTYLDRNNQQNRHTLPIIELTQRFRFLFGYFQEQVRRAASTLLLRDNSTDKVREFVDIGVSLEYRDKHLYAYEFNNLKNTLCSVLSGKICSSIDWSEYEDKTTRNFILNVQYIFGLEAYFEVAKLSDYEIYHKIVDTLNRQHSAALEDISPSNQWECQDPSIKCDRLQLHMFSIEHMLKNFSIAFKNPDPEEALKAFLELRHNSLFALIGGRILMDMIPPEKRDQLSATIIEMSGKNRTPISRIFTSSDTIREEAKQRTELYDLVRNIQTTIFNSDYDLRLQAVHQDLATLNPLN